MSIAEDDVDPLGLGLLFRFCVSLCMEVKDNGTKIKELENDRRKFIGKEMIKRNGRKRTGEREK